MGVAFPDAEVASAIDELQRVITRLEDAITRRQTTGADALNTWQGRCREAFAADHRASQQAAIHVVDELRAARIALHRAQDEAADRRARWSAVDEVRDNVWFDGGFWS